MYRLMLIDDDDIIRTKLIKSYDWEDMGFEPPYTARDGKEALNRMPEIHPDVVVSDIRMPVMDGLELIRNLKIKYPNIRTVLLSSYGEFEYAQRAIEYGAYAYLLKSADGDQIRRTFGRIRDELDQETRRFIAMSGGMEWERYGFLKQMLRNRLQTADYEKTAKRLGMKLNDSKVCCMVCELLQQEGKDRSAENFICAALRNYLNRFTENGLRHELIQEGKSRITIILSSGPGQFGERLTAFAYDIHRYLANQLSVRNDCGIGDIGKGLSTVNQSYVQANSALSMRFFKGREDQCGFYIFRKSAMTEPTAEIRRKLTGLENEIIENVRMLNRDAVQRKINQYFELMKAKKLDLDFVIGWCCRFVMTVKASILAMKAEGIDDESFSAIHEKIRRAVYLHELHEAVFREISRMVDQIQRASLLESNPTLKNLLAMIDNDPEQRITLESAASFMHMNISYFSVFFKEKAGTNFTDYVTRVRIDHAKKMLEASEYKISIIANKVGYNDTSYFCNVFKKIVGITPLEYRKKAVL